MTIEEMIKAGFPEEVIEAYRQIQKAIFTEEYKKQIKVYKQEQRALADELIRYIEDLVA
jgi:hypothetical protein